jgi:hypothetical protein
MALREENSALHWAATRPEDNTPATAVAVGHFVQVPLTPGARHSTACRPILLRPRASPGVKLKKPFSVTSFFRYSLNSFNHLGA